GRPINLADKSQEQRFEVQIVPRALRGARDDPCLIAYQVFPLPFAAGAFIYESHHSPCVAIFSNTREQVVRSSASCRPARHMSSIYLLPNGKIYRGRKIILNRFSIGHSALIASTIRLINSNDRRIV